VPQDCILGNFQPSLRDSNWKSVVLMQTLPGRADISVLALRASTLRSGGFRRFDAVVSLDQGIGTGQLQQLGNPVVYRH